MNSTGREPSVEERRGRRSFLRTMVGYSTVLGAGGLVERRARGESGASELELIVRNSRPLDAETPVEAFDRFLTPNRLFFKRSHFTPPAMELISPRVLRVEGGVGNPLSLSIEDLEKFQKVSVTAVLQCAGNGRGLFEPTIPGIGWEKGAVGNAEWTGVRLADILEKAGVKPGHDHVRLFGADAPPSPKTPPYYRSIPLRKAIDGSTIIAAEMNGEPLPWLHGGPMRLIAPGWAGNHWIKWLRAIEISDAEAPGFYMQTGYKMPKRPYPPGAPVPPEDMISLTTLNVKSLIARPGAGTQLPKGRHAIQGVAWSGGDFHVTRVDVSVTKHSAPDAWKPATLLTEPRPYSWRLWKYEWDSSEPGPYRIRSRATDSSGAVQPEKTVWNRSGYLWNSIDQIMCEIRS